MKTVILATLILAGCASAPTLPTDTVACAVDIQAAVAGQSTDAAKAEAAAAAAAVSSACVALGADVNALIASQGKTTAAGASVPAATP